MFLHLNIDFYTDYVRISFTCNFTELQKINQMNTDKYFLLKSEWDELQVLTPIPNIN